MTDKIDYGSGRHKAVRQEPKPGVAYTKLNYLENKLIDDFLRDKLEVVEGVQGERWASYKDGWNDARVATAIGGIVNSNHVSGVRRQAYGNFPPAVPQPRASRQCQGDSVLLDRVQVLEDKLLMLNRVTIDQERHIAELKHELDRITTKLRPLLD